MARGGPRNGHVGADALGVASQQGELRDDGAWSDSGNLTSVRKAPDSSGRYSLWILLCSKLASSAREAST